MATFFLRATVTRCEGEWPCTSADGLMTRNASAESAKGLAPANVTMSSRPLAAVSSFRGLELLRRAWSSATLSVPARD